MPQLNQCFFIGHLGKDPEQGTIKKGNTYTRFRLAVDQGKDPEPLWFTVVCWNKLAQLVHKPLHKGSAVFVQGRLLVQTYRDKQDIERQSIELVATNVQVLEKQPIEIDTDAEGEI
jgi:single-strand DNA-binding protein